MELRHIRYFLAVAEERHFTRAAAKVGIGQPPLSQQIKDLEGEVGAALFHRLAHGAELTEAGKAFLAGVKEMPLIAERATMAARRATRGPRRDGIAACRLHRIGYVQRRGTVYHPCLSPRLSRYRPHARGGQYGTTHYPLTRGNARRRVPAARRGRYRRAAGAQPLGGADGGRPS